jgi:hypothetical protein
MEAKMDGNSFEWRESIPAPSWWKRKVDVKHSLILMTLIAGATLAAIVMLDSLGVHWAPPPQGLLPAISLLTASGQG